MDADKILKEYNRLKQENRRLLSDNRSKQILVDSVMHSKVGRVARKVNSVRGRIANAKNGLIKKKTTNNPSVFHQESYISHFEKNKDYSDFNTDIKTLAFYLPQFHTIPENDKAWGKGFTEWTNTKPSKPRFDGHYQPREPHDDFGYYTLDNKETIAKQIVLAKQHKIYGFSFYYYWFSGKRLLEKPIDIFLKNKDLDFPFCLCWANGNWTKRWDGKEDDVIMAQPYKKDDPKRFIDDIKKYVSDPRYIKVDGKPIILVYNPGEVPDFKTTVEEWRKEARAIGIGEIQVWSYRSLFDDGTENYKFVDAEFDFAPNAFNLPEYKINSPDGLIYNYQTIVQSLEEDSIYKNHLTIKPFYYSITTGWDNACRRKDKNYTVFANYNPEMFYNWARLVMEKIRNTYPEDRRFMFVNAWNEWAEGTYLEPDKKYGYTNINTLSKAILDLPYSDEVVMLNSKSAKNKNPGKVALQAHIYYEDLADEILSYLEKIPFEFDLYISTNTAEKKSVIDGVIKKKHLKCGKIIVDVVENRGRDIYPFIKQISPVYQEYDYIGHIHSKKTVEHGFGAEWRKYLYDQLFGSDNQIERVFALFNDDNVGIVFPGTYEKISHALTIGPANIKIVNKLLKKVNLPQLTGDDGVMFPAGSMFWARKDAIAKLFELGLSQKDFPDELGQIDGTTAHAVERLFGIIPKQSGYVEKQYYFKPKH